MYDEGCGEDHGEAVGCVEQRRSKPEELQYVCGYLTSTGCKMTNGKHRPHIFAAILAATHERSPSRGQLRKAQGVVVTVPNCPMCDGDHVVQGSLYKDSSIRDVDVFLNSDCEIGRNLQ